MVMRIVKLISLCLLYLVYIFYLFLVYLLAFSANLEHLLKHSAEFANTLSASLKK